MFYSILRGFARIVLIFVFRLKISGKENVPKDGGLILAVNHRSNWDPILAAVAFPRHLTFMAKEELFKNPVFGGLIKALGAFPVHRGAGDVGAIKGALSILKKDRVMLMFPQGHRMKDGVKGKAKPGVAMIAQRAKVPVVPMNISGKLKWMHKVTITIGEPISFEEYYGQKPDSEKIQELADGVLDTIWRMGE